MTCREWLAALAGGRADAALTALYGGLPLAPQRARYAALAEGLLDGGEAAGEARFFTAAGRTELGGNHTDHQGGKALAAAIQLDAAACAAPRADTIIRFRSTGFPDVEIDIADTAARSEERGTTEALLRGIAAGFAERGVAVRGWTANADSAVLPGSGLSSSAALETLAAKIFDGLYGGGALPPPELAKIAQKAENLYYGKPSGLMDQAASAAGGAVALDFSAPDAAMRRIAFDPEAAGYTLCVVNTGGSHAGLTADYAAIPAEMRSVAAFFGAARLGEVPREALDAALGGPALRARCGDRAILRALHFFDENARVDAMNAALGMMNAAASPEEREEAFGIFLDLVNASGASSWELLQNLYPPRSGEQGIALALALTRRFAARRGAKAACRPHGGGFAGTAQAYIPSALFAAYRPAMEALFGGGSVTPLRIRAAGARELTIND